MNGFKKEEKMSEEYKEELALLKKILEKSMAEQRECMENAMHPMVSFMKQFLNAYESFEKVEQKLYDLNEKLGCEECKDE